jgi:hypothetical protein
MSKVELDKYYAEDLNRRLNELTDKDFEWVGIMKARWEQMLEKPFDVYADFWQEIEEKGADSNQVRLLGEIIGEDLA